jgi:glutamine phosphoribosylpyrophosphate amidotransferase
MCSIIGFKGTYNKEVLNKVFKYSRIRGLHSFGYSYYSPELTTKKFLDYNEFVKDIDNIKPNLFIAHFRYSTSGDFKDNCNNQPLTQNDTSIAFNGVISQKTKLEMENEYEIELFGDNDGYILLNKFNNIQFIQSNITFALVGLKNNKLFALKNRKRPLWLYENDCILLTSTEDIMKRSGITNSKEIKNLIYHEW